MAEFNKVHPHGAHAFIQWKGTDACVDLYCECGASGHYDGDFLYFWVCPRCGATYEVGCFVGLNKVSAEDLLAMGVDRGAVQTSPDYSEIDWDAIRKGVPNG